MSHSATVQACTFAFCSPTPQTRPPGLRVGRPRGSVKWGCIVAQPFHGVVILRGQVVSRDLRVSAHASLRVRYNRFIVIVERTERAGAGLALGFFVFNPDAGLQAILTDRVRKDGILTVGSLCRDLRYFRHPNTLLCTHPMLRSHSITPLRQRHLRGHVPPEARQLPLELSLGRVVRCNEGERLSDHARDPAIYRRVLHIPLVRTDRVTPLLSVCSPRLAPRPSACLISAAPAVSTRYCSKDQGAIRRLQACPLRETLGHWASNSACTLQRYRPWSMSLGVHTRCRAHFEQCVSAWYCTRYRCCDGRAFPAHLARSFSFVSSRCVHSGFKTLQDGYHQ